MLDPRSAPGGGVVLPPSPEKIQSKFDLSIALTLSTWPALTLAVQNSWGGPDSSEKRDWFAGAISDLMAATPDADVDYLEDFLLQVMEDEFDINIEDGSGEEIAAKVIGLRKLSLQGDFAMIDDMYRQWQERKSRGSGGRVNIQQHMDTDNDDDDDDDTDRNSDELDFEDEDVAMEEAPSLIKAPKEKLHPKVDGEGFTEVISKKRR